MTRRIRKLSRAISRAVAADRRAWLVIGNPAASPSIDFYNRATGNLAAPSIAGMSYALSPNGRYICAGLLQTSMYGCPTSFFIYEHGTWNVQRNKIPAGF